MSATATVKHTPGPWHVDTLGKVRCAAEDGKGFIADPGDGRYAGSIPRLGDVSLANAHLIAAAPTMLAMIKALRRTIVSMGADLEVTAPDSVNATSYRDELRRIDALIAKAEGRAS